MLDVEYAQLSHSSRTRDSGQCFASVTPKSAEQTRTHGWMFALADEIESQGENTARRTLALETVSLGFVSASPYELHRALLPRLIQHANAKLLHTAQAGNPIAFLACALRSDCAVVSHVGDLRCYLVRRSHAELLTRDHTMANDQRRLGSVLHSETNRSGVREPVSRSLGSQVFVAVDVTERQIMAGDVLVICSYGLYTCVPEMDMELIISDNRDVKLAARELVAAAATSPRRESISVQVIRIGESKSQTSI